MKEQITCLHMGDFYKELKQVILPQRYSLHEENEMYYLIIILHTVILVNEHSIMSLFKYLYLKNYNQY